MRRLIVGTGIGATRFAFMPLPGKSLDRDTLNNPHIRDPESGVDRVLMIFDRRADGSTNAELNFINLSGFAGMFLGGIYGGLLEAKFANINFRESNEATLFETRLVAQKKLQEQTTLGFGKGAFRWGRRCGIFCWSFAFVSTVVSVYRNKDSVTDYSIAGGVTGALFKTHLGMKGMLSGAFFGTIIGTVGGAFTVGAMKICGIKMAEYREEMSAYIFERNKVAYGLPGLAAEDDIILETFGVNKEAKQETIDYLAHIEAEDPREKYQKELEKKKSKWIGLF